MPGKIPKKYVSLKKSKEGFGLSAFSTEIAPKIVSTIRAMCLRCRGTKNLCGKARCPVIVKFYSTIGRRSSELNTDFLDGNSPPSVFIGRYGYPKVSVGPLVPPTKGDTSIFSSPEMWFGSVEMDDIVEFRGRLARGKKRLKQGVEITDHMDREVERTRYLVLAKKPAEAEVKFDRKLSDAIRFDNRTQPYGPSAMMERFEIGSMNSHRHLERIFYDEDLKAEDALLDLFEKGVRVSRIQELFMVGGTGLKDRRRFVPTRWSITAVDDIIGKSLKERVKSYRPIDRYEVYATEYLDNRWTVILTPSLWQFELIEAFYPGTTWNLNRDRIAVYGDYELLEGRTDYASLGGCYYAARLAVAEGLVEKSRQAGAIVLREAYPGYILPVGVWNVRESIRNALKTKPRTFDMRSQVMDFLGEKLDLKLEEWKSVSNLFSLKRSQRRIQEFF